MEVFGDRGSGDGITVGIVDSALGPPPDVADRYDVDEPRDYTDVNVRDPTDHGTLVFGAMSPFARGATFRFYRLLGGEAKKGTDLLEPIRDAARDGVDLLNVSAGYSNPPDGGYLVRRAIRIEGERHGITVVSAAGNKEGDPEEVVTYPARFDEVVSVGGFVPECRGTVDPQNDRRIWIDTSNRSGFPGVQGPLCNQVGCDPSRNCKSRYEHWWGGNLQPVDGNPDTVAPVHYPTADSGGPFLVPGTSFSAPVVTGLLAAVLERVGTDADPQRVRRAVRNGSVLIHDESAKKFHAQLVESELS